MVANPGEVEVPDFVLGPLRRAAELPILVEEIAGGRVLVNVSEMSLDPEWEGEPMLRELDSEIDDVKERLTDGESW